ncbi:7-methyl-GTP pyrophosphatase [Xanthomonas sacchari]|uniref:7-methyl-GTP pyrophosphatase n=1 Tax=Xanthomonas sacchari TaxID=56458 RepID=A0ABT3DQE5_9XANT|nr:Maf family nucleotide pyrophosphatase [Xanthomonas sacchari]MCW0397596.1 7-methyl-GTP pyrophosphatase [Xanthomonas sacchari]MCW0404734.1 7-methyl-GTP pyrophosphatase [Xanthomonas sacchari]MCW0418889.1 7-methyl-GTP pyrophosphatase [Xanthomonas sacchari]UYK71768.1 Maf family nucleotide pyrophosphatase [Xanthomonas sacchari]
MPPLILASTSAYRRELLQRLRLPFDCARPQVDETPLPGEAPLALAQRLAAAKAAAVAATAGEAWVIGSDQVAELEGQPLGKPGEVAAAHAQLAAMSGRSVRFHTAVCLQRGARTLHACDLTEVQFRDLQADAIARYVAAEQPLDCAGSFKCEGLGISLFRAIQTQDPTALIGLPLIALSELLREAGYTLP